MSATAFTLWFLVECLRLYISCLGFCESRPNLCRPSFYHGAKPDLSPGAKPDLPPGA